ncbi:PLD nuclease N-terminal domain-containing protein [Phycicoccus duodecadis]|uniref:Phospholipase D-like protein n=1 Tax=Phycicoccus duodecadis TaxID=173053 RepID=A0A2N3YHV0_9MICO|nr:PLD nuclease N-terminal domain-containing protein [Phycicoccus duodecadis]PKW26433.1 phospholipase D-like protein [Phycicoccus duodecadis]
MLRYLPLILSLALTIYCLVDCIQTDDLLVRNLPKIAWLLLVLLFPVIGPVAWLVAGRPSREAATQAGLTQQERWDLDRRRRGQGNGPGPRPPRGPDDDPEFLRGL